MKPPTKDYQFRNIKLEPVELEPAWTPETWREIAQAVACLALAFVIVVMCMCL